MGDGRWRRRVDENWGRRYVESVIVATSMTLSYARLATEKRAKSERGRERRER